MSKNIITLVPLFLLINNIRLLLAKSHLDLKIMKMAFT